jgi:hypothetical protein
VASSKISSSVKSPTTPSIVQSRAFETKVPKSQYFTNLPQDIKHYIAGNLMTYKEQTIFSTLNRDLKEFIAESRRHQHHIKVPQRKNVKEFLSQYTRNGTSKSSATSLDLSQCKLRDEDCKFIADNFPKLIKLNLERDTQQNKNFIIISKPTLSIWRGPLYLNE